MLVEDRLQHIDERTQRLELLTQDVARSVRELTEQVRRQNGRVSALEERELARRLADAEERGRADAIITWATVGKIGGAAGAVSAIIAVVGLLVARVAS